ncbi:MAG: EVE domain-containing protein [Bacteroidota bacterium]|nr:EVE domain-containing protein [Bacteroidota bacterium]
MSTKYWLFKTDPADFAWADLKKSKDKTTFWSGVRNYQARNYLRDEIKQGDIVLFYHSNEDPNAIYGFCEVVKEGYPDSTQFDPDDSHFFPSATTEKPIWFMVDIKLKKEFRLPVLLSSIKGNPKLKNIRLLQKGNRLSVMPVTKEEFEEIAKMGDS